MVPDDSSMQCDNDKAVVIEGVAHNGKPCRIVDNTGTVAREELEALLTELIEQRRFGLSGRSVAGGDRIRLGEPDFTHIQLGGELYRFILLPYEARIEVF
jgi:hypothetical protein